MSTARRLAAGLRISLRDLPQRVLDKLGLGQQPLESSVLLAQLLEFFGGVGVHPAVSAAPVVQRRRRDTEFGGDLLAGLALRGQLVRAAQLAHDVLSGMPLPTSHTFHRPFQPDIGRQDSKTGLIWPRGFEPWLCELRDRIGGRPERFELSGADVTEVAVTAFNVVEVVDVIGDGRD
jgi:hypothetical protein